MRVYVKSAGASVHQDYSWVDESGKQVDIDFSILSYNVKGAKFVWKSTRSGICIFCNSVVDRSRVDLYNRPLRNYILFEGSWNEADKMFICFSNMLLQQTEFEHVLNASVQNTGGNSKAGFSVDFQKILSFCNAGSLQTERQDMARFLCEKDAVDARTRLLSEICGMLHGCTCLTVLVGGEVSADRLEQLKPDRALLDNLDKDFYCASDRKSANVSQKTVLAAGGIAALLLVVAAVSRRKKS